MPCFFSGSTEDGGVKETRHWLRTKCLQRAKSSFHQQKGKQEKTILLVTGEGELRAIGQIPLATCNIFSWAESIP